MQVWQLHSQLPFCVQIFGAEDPQQTDMRDVASQQGQGASLATSRAEAWADFIMHKVDEYGAGLAMLEKRIHKAEVEALQRNKLPLLMLHSYAAAEAKQVVDTELQRPALIAAEREAARQAELRRQEEQRQAALLAQQRAQQEAVRRQQQQQQQLMAAQQAAMLQQQQVAATASQQQQHQQQFRTQQAPIPRQQGMPMQPQMAGMSQGQQAVRSAVAPPGTGPPVAAAAGLQQAGGGKPMSAADAKAKQLAALAARINQRK